MNIAVYSGSFDPLHIGHLAILSYLTREGLFDEVYLVVSPQSPFKHASQAQTGAQRHAAAVAALARHPELRARAEDIELGMTPPHYTIRTLDALREREPGNTFTLIIGADNLESFPRWRDHDRILLEYGIAVYPRKGSDISTDTLPPRVQIINTPLIDISSTDIRERIRRGEPIDALVHPRVAALIQRQGWYKE